MTAVPAGNIVPRFLVVHSLELLLSTRNVVHSTLSSKKTVVVHTAGI